MSELITIANFRTRLEAEVAGGLLGDSGIPYLIQSAEGLGIVPMPGGASLLVRSETVTDALKALGYPRLAEGSEA